MSRSIHPDIKKFKAFVKNNPHVLRDVKSGDKTLQDLFEEWVLFGEEDEIWDTYREESDSGDVGSEEDIEEKEETETKDKKSKTAKDSLSAQDLMAIVKKMNMNDLQQHLAQFSGVLASVQELLLQFKQNENQGSIDSQQEQQQNSPFSFRDD